MVSFQTGKSNRICKCVCVYSLYTTHIKNNWNLCIELENLYFCNFTVYQQTLTSISITSTMLSLLESVRTKENLYAQTSNTLNFTFDGDVIQTYAYSRQHTKYHYFHFHTVIGKCVSIIIGCNRKSILKYANIFSVAKAFVLLLLLCMCVFVCVFSFFLHCFFSRFVSFGIINQIHSHMDVYTFFLYHISVMCMCCCKKKLLGNLHFAIFSMIL